jgi:hypothetical protein
MIHYVAARWNDLFPWGNKRMKNEIFIELLSISMHAMHRVASVASSWVNPCLDFMVTNVTLHALRSSD